MGAPQEEKESIERFPFKEESSIQDDHDLFGHLPESFWAEEKPKERSFLDKVKGFFSDDIVQLFVMAILLAMMYLMDH
jgi:hypothetical protein